MTDRIEDLRQWLDEALKRTGYKLEPVSGDASFRRYYRLRDRHGSYVVMDAPPDQLSTKPFIDVSRRLDEAGLNVPRVLAGNLKHGFLLISDLGDRTYLSALNDETREDLYEDALESLLVMQRQVTAQDLPNYDRALLSLELGLFRDWFLAGHLGLELSAEEARVLDRAYSLLVDTALEQPRVFVHRDYHSRNLMVTPVQNPGILDFQDAVAGPVSYDLVSLLRDCYIAWPDATVERWLREYHHRATGSDFLGSMGLGQFTECFDLMGAQRHLKAIGIFARLWHRDGKPGYLADIPRTLDYVLNICERYPPLYELGRLLADLGVRQRHMELQSDLGADLGASG